MTKVLVPLAEGCEELEAVTIIDLLRRAGIEVTTAGLNKGMITASRGVTIKPDTDLDSVLNDDYDMIVLPGGLPGAGLPNPSTFSSYPVPITWIMIQGSKIFYKKWRPVKNIPLLSVLHRKYLPMLACLMAKKPPVILVFSKTSNYPTPNSVKIL